MRSKEPLALLTLGALGIVYGDIGTSPLYAFNEAFFGSGSLTTTVDHITGVASLIVWLLVLTVGIKYSILVLRADHDGEGGVFALMGLLEHARSRKHLTALTALLMFSAGLLFGDSIITPAISVLSAVEGLKVYMPHLSSAVVPVTVFILTAIFTIQRWGTHKVGVVYGPIMLLWFTSIGAIGLYHLLQVPQVIGDIINPLSAVRLITSLDPYHLAILVGSVFLALTGSEALYADMGHFGKHAIRIGWITVVLPGLALSYAGQAAYLLAHGSISQGNLFYSLVPEQLLVPMIILATAATSIASVALIFGAYSIVSQAVVLDLLPRIRIVHTNAHTEGQIYLPAVNWTLYVGSVLLVFIFGSASHLAAAYGFAVSGVMFITTLAMYTIARLHWEWSRPLALIVFGPFALLDALFVFGNSVKFTAGGYIPFTLGLIIFTAILTWRWGRRIVRRAYEAYTASRSMAWLLDFKRRLDAAGGRLCDEGRRCAVTFERTVIFLMSRPILTIDESIPVKLRVFLKRSGAVPKNLILLNINQKRIPYVHDHYEVVELGQGVMSVKATFGFMENPDASGVIRELYNRGIFPRDVLRCTIEASEDEIIVDNDLPFLLRVRGLFFKFLQSLSVPRYRYFGLMGEAATGLSKIVIPVRMSKRGARVEIPEFSLTQASSNIDPDTHQPSTIPYVPLA